MNSEKVIWSVILLILAAVSGILIYSGSRATQSEETPMQVTREMDLPAAMDESEDEEMEESMDNQELQNIVEIASNDERFSTLVSAVQAAGLVDTLAEGGPFTVFAPTNDAFDKIPEETFNEILNDQDQLTQILSYHIVQGKVMAEDVVELTSAETVQGSAIDISVDGNSVMVNNANVVITDIEAENGVIHVIDTVLIPQ